MSGDHCGTVYGVKRHYAEGSKVCEPCRQARKEYRYYNAITRGRRMTMSKPAQSGVVHMKTTDVPYPDTSQALCVGEDSIFWYGDAEGDHNLTKRGKAICADCPVRLDCLNWALAQNEMFGVWGGLSPRERQDIRVGRREAS